MNDAEPLPPVASPPTRSGCAGAFRVEARNNEFSVRYCAIAWSSGDAAMDALTILGDALWGVVVTPLQGARK